MNKKISFITIVVMMLMIFCSCSDRKSVSNSQIKKTSIEFKEKEDSEKVKISQEKYLDFASKINIDNMEYPNSELFGMDKALEKRNGLNLQVSHHQYDFLGTDKTVDSVKLFETVKKNNKEYITNSADKHFYKEFSDNQVKKYCGMIADTLNWCLKNSDNIDISMLGCKLGNLKILEKNSPNIGAYNGCTGMMYICPSSVENQERSTHRNDIEEMTISHETMHMVQSHCYCGQNRNDGFIGISCYFNDLSINPLRVSWLYEGSAELNTSVYKNLKPGTYTYMIDLIQSINLAKVACDNVKAGETEKICFQTNPEVLYKYLGFENNRKAEEFLYSAEIMLVKPDDFFEVYESEKGAVTDKNEFINSEYKTVVYETVSRIFYRSLAEKLSSSQLSLNDVFCLISMYERNAERIMQLKTKEAQQTYKKYIDSYTNIKNDFFALLETDNITEKFSDYKMTYENNGKYINGDMSWLDNEKRDFILNISEN